MPKPTNLTPEQSKLYDRIARRMTSRYEEYFTNENDEVDRTGLDELIDSEFRFQTSELYRSLEETNNKYMRNVVYNPDSYLERTHADNDMDHLRYANKYMLRALAMEYSENTENKDLKALFDNVFKYGKDLRNGENKEERELYDKILNDAQRIYEELDSHLAEKLEGADEKTDLNADAEFVKYQNDLRMAANILMYFEGQKDGNLMIPAGSEITVDATKAALGRDIEAADFIDVFNKNLKDKKLFTHDPSPNDLKQGEIGDCFVMAGLSSLAVSHPEVIKNAIVDNNDGTCTVRFFQKIPGGNGAGFDDTYKPVYVKVDKVAPYLGSSEHAIWGTMIERAFAASGLYTAEGTVNMTLDPYGQPVPKDINERYNELKKMDRSSWPTHEECPWLISENGDLHPYTPSYKNIVGGNAAMFMEFLGGEDFQHVKEIIPHNDLYRIPSPKEMHSEIFEAAFNDSDLSFISERDKEKLPKSTEAVDRIRMLHAMVSNGRMPIENSDGSPDYSRLTTYGCAVFNLMFNSYNMSVVIPKYDDRTEINCARTFQGFKDYVAECAKNPNSPHYKEFSTMKLRGNELAMKTFDTLMDKFMDKAKFMAEQKYRNVEPLTGEYNKRELDFFNDIKERVASENVTLGTSSKFDGKDVTDTIEHNGLYGKHAYTVTGVETRTYGGKEFHFLRLRNPHAIDGGRDYRYNEKTQKLEAFNSGKLRGGECFVEISDLTDVDHIDITGHGRDLAPIAQNPLSRQTVSAYSRALETFEKEFSSAYSFYSLKSKDSPEYTNLVNTVKIAREKLSCIVGKDRSELDEQIRNIRDASEKYVKHCGKTPDRAGRTRDRRLAACQGLSGLFEAADAKADNPKEYMLGNISNRIANHYAKLHHMEQPPKDFAKNIRGCNVFKKSFEKCDMIKLQKAASVTDEALYNGFKSFSMKELGKTAEAPVAQANVSNPVNNGPGLGA